MLVAQWRMSDMPEFGRPPRRDQNRSPADAWL